MAVLITGAGIIGSHIARLLAARGERVVLLDAAPQPAAVASVVDSPLVELLQGDVTDYPALLALVRGRQVRAIVHTAAILARAIAADPARGVAVNVLGTTHVLQAAKDAGLARVVLSSSLTVGYPAFASFRGEAFPEDFAMRVISERPGSLYTVTKLAGEHIALVYRQQHGVDAVALRFGAVLGAWRGPNRSIPGRAVLSLLEPARERRPAVIDDPLLVWEGGEELIDARDCARASVAALDAAQAAAGVYNVSTGTPRTYQELVAAVRRLYPGLELDMRVRPRGGIAGFPSLRPAPSDLRLAREELGFRPSYSLDDAVEAMDACLG